MKQKNSIILLLSLVFVAARVPAIRGFEVETHTKLSEKATDASQLNNYLTTVLGFEFPLGSGEEVGQGLFKTVRQLIADVGAVNEDKPDIRSRTHFHDPIKAWAQAGLSWPSQTFESSVLWSQNPNQDWGGKHSWQDARNSYFNALTASNTTDRKRFYAETFESLGHLIHLVQDAAVPAHTRNDTHIGFFIGNGYGFPVGNPDRFHHWARVRGEPAINSSGSQPFDSSIVNQTYNGLVPIAGIIDTTTTAGQSIPSAATNIGIAEYSNANFFSDDTILKDYGYPNTTQLDLTQEPGPDGPEQRFYLRKSFAPGPTGYRAAVSSRLAGFLPFGSPTQQWELDDNVMVDYGSLLFPRAIGYSAGLIDYFFRGTLFAEGVSAADFLPNAPPTTLSAWLQNLSPDEETGVGSAVLVLFYNSQIGTSESFPSILVSNPVPVNNFNSEGQLATFSFGALPFPATMSWNGINFFSRSSYKPMMVYRGQLGRENDAVVATVMCNHFSFDHQTVDPPDNTLEQLSYVAGCEAP